jgi:hypothetical protein
MKRPTNHRFYLDSKYLRTISAFDKKLKFNPVHGYFDGELEVHYSYFHGFFIKNVSDADIKEAFERCACEAYLPSELFNEFEHLKEYHKIIVRFSASLQNPMWVQLIRDNFLINKEDYKYLSPSSILITLTGIIKLNTDPKRVVEQALVRFPKRYHWIGCYQNLEEFLIRVDDGYVLDFEQITHNFDLPISNRTENTSISSYLSFHELTLWL